jgi:biopolymer transport protein ExbD
MSRRDETPDLPMAPMVALFALLVVFMIQFYAVSAETLNLSADTVLPSSTSTEMLESALKLEVTQDNIVLEGTTVARVDDLRGTDLLIPGLDDALRRLKDRTERLAAVNPSVTFEGRLILIADKRVKYDTITRIMYTSGRSGFNQINMAVLQGGNLPID